MIISSKGAPEWGNLAGETNTNYIGLQTSSSGETTIGFPANLPEAGRVIVKATVANRSGKPPPNAYIVVGFKDAAEKVESKPINFPPSSPAWFTASVEFRVDPTKTGEWLIGLRNRSPANKDTTLFLTRVTVEYLQ